MDEIKQSLYTGNITLLLKKPFYLVRFLQQRKTYASLYRSNVSQRYSLKKVIKVYPPYHLLTILTLEQLLLQLLFLQLFLFLPLV